MAMRRDQVFYAALFLLVCLLWASASWAIPLEQRLILTDHVRKARWAGTPEQLIDFRVQDMKSMEVWFTGPVE
jgi:HAMP domain-containing protein